MRNLIMFALIGIIVFFAGSLHASLLVYEGFDYDAGSDVTTPLNGGLGFVDAWAPGQQGGRITVYDETAETVINGNSGGELTWNGVVDNVPTSPAVGSRFIGSGPSGTADRITAIRTLSASAGDLAGADKVLWASVVWHQQGNNYGRHVGFTLGTDGLANRAANIDHGGNAIGVGGAFNTGLVTPVIFENGNIAVRTTTGAANVSYSLDNLVILKFVFADGDGLDTVTAYRFTENDILDEATFNANAISASYPIDQDTLNIVSFSQSRGQEAIDEIRIGDTFADVIGFQDPTLATVDAGSNWTTWSGEPVQLDDVNVENNDTGAGPLTLEWASIAPAGVNVLFSSNSVAQPEITITKPADGSFEVVDCTLTVTQSGKDSVESTMKIYVYDDPCKAAVAIGSHVIIPSDINADCITDFEDLFEIANSWLVDFSLTEGVDK